MNHWRRTSAQYSTQPRRIALAYALVSFIRLFRLWWHRGHLIKGRFVIFKRQQVASHVDTLGPSLTLAIHQKLTLVTDMRAYEEVGISRHGTFEVGETETFVAKLYNNTTGIHNIAIGADRVMQFVYPYEENKAVLGYEPVKDPRPYVRADVKRAIANGEVVLPPPEGLVLALKDQSGQVLGGNETIFSQAPVTYQIPLSEGSWELAAVPAHGWHAENPGILWFYRILGLLIVVMLPLNVYLSISRREQLALVVDQHIKELSATHRQPEQLVVERQQAEEALRISEERLRIISETTSDSAYEFLVNEDQTLTLAWITDGFARVTGFTPEEFEIRGGWARLIYPEDIPTAQRRGERALSDQADVNEFRIVTQSGAIRRLRDNGKPEWNEQLGRVTRIFGAAEDITERVQVEKRLQEYRERLEEMVAKRTRELQDAQERLIRQERLDVLDELAGSVGHKLHNPLGVIANACYYLNMMMPDGGEKVKEYLELIQTNTQEAVRIVSDLIDFACKKPVERAPTKVSELVAAVISQHLSPENVTLSVDIPGDLPPVLVNSRQIGQVLGNLVTNAYQAMPEGRVISIQASVSSEQSAVAGELIADNCLLITVRDTGPGIPPENMDRIFEPLFTTKARGIALGLAISEKSVEANQGKIEVESHIGESTIFTLIVSVYKDKL